MRFARATPASYVVGLSQGFWKCRFEKQSSCTLHVLLVMLATCKTEIPMISLILISFLVLEGLQSAYLQLRFMWVVFLFLFKEERGK